MKRMLVTACVLVLAGWVGNLQAQQAANPTGTWKWQAQGRGGQTQEQTLKLKLDGDKLTGALVMGEREIAISEATFKDGTVTFKVTREGRGGGQPRTQTYTGKLEGDTIKGKITRERQGETVEQDWEAKRDKEAQA